MRKNSPRKWLHAVLDLLPVILIPVFMIYSHRHEINTGSIVVQEKEVVDFNQLYDADTFSNCVVSNNYVSVKKENDVNWYDFFYDFDFIGGHQYLASARDVNFTARSYFIAFGISNDNFWVTLSSSQPQKIFTCPYDYRYSGGYVFPASDVNGTLCSAYYNLFDLTQMYGSGNEPTLSEFNQTFTDYYYDYTLSHKELINGDLVTYNDTDIMSQFTYQLYNSVDKYFNMGNVFNLNGVYDWFNLNIFNGTAPIYVYIVWQIVLYEFVMDLLFLLYGLFMWFIDMVQHLMDKPFKSIK